MSAKFNLMKNGKVATSVWANKKKKEMYPANQNSFGFNAQYILGDWFYNKYGKNMKNQSRKIQLFIVLLFGKINGKRRLSISKKSELLKKLT